ncbi:MAG: hypothetical protein ONA69_05510 [candidate division KSB1 bacterium]|nr:hypothetical protein [candidate division KSB1 bacterium]
MMWIAKIISLIGLLLTLIPAVLVFTNRIPLEEHYRLMLFGMLLWFASSPIWMLRKK